MLYRDLARFNNEALDRLEEIMAEHGLARVSEAKASLVHLDIDTTVLQRSGADIEGAVPGPNSRLPGHPSHHPIIARIAETGTVVGAQLRPGNTGLGDDDVPLIRQWARRAKATLAPSSELCVRIDAGGDCTAIFDGLHQEQVFYLVKAHITQDLYQAILNVKKWTTRDVDADDKPTRQIAELKFQRQTWRDRDVNVRIIMVRSRDRQGRQLPLPGKFDDDQWTVQVFLTNRVDHADDIA